MEPSQTATGSPSSPPRAGQTAPGFALPNQHGELIESRSLGEQAYFLVFYPFAFSAVCGSELEELEEVREEFAARNIRIMGVSVDHKYALRIYADQARFGFDLLADFWPHGAVASSYGAFNFESGAATRHTFLIAEGRVVDSFSSPIHQARAIARYREAMDLLT
ncbi:redoxin domain-containing protein [Paeniglutamicibacter psychrophenolicus]|uniref:redoxin domain-containing protein n=1 Tax=Paeniglutamicibacter psychrophenolicus TaxID=257454 RepID=UPI0027D7A1A8|nr:redoxin domain-containing protein [Paeniglutamicibacter psychrophenolicus]